MIGVWVAVASVAATGAGIVWWRWCWQPRVERYQVQVSAVVVGGEEAARLQELFDLEAYVPEHERQ